jgi:amyloid beta precursor protein binding protein 1
VEEEDLGVNFFVDDSWLGKSRAEGTVKLLEELNPDVKGHFAERFDGTQIYTLVIYTTPIRTENETLLMEYSKKNKVPLLHINSAGFYAYFHIQYPGNFPIVDTHPEQTAAVDLRLLSPWPELAAFGQGLTQNLDNLPNHEHGHVPYVALLLHYLEEWKATHNSEPPITSAQKAEFKKLVAAGTRTDTPEGGEENFDEAVAAVNTSIKKTSLPSSVREIFNYVPSESEAKSNFWIITAAIHAFYERHTELPLPGSVPDMKAQSETYVRLQNIYKAKARADVDEVLATVSASPGGNTIPREEVEVYCKNAAFVKLIRHSQPSEDRLKSVIRTELTQEFELFPSLAPVLLALKSSEHLLPPLQEPDLLVKMSQLYRDTDERVNKTIKEVARAQGKELHNTAALVGGMVAQEVIKLVTKQYVPIDNCCVWDGIQSRAQVFRI